MEGCFVTEYPGEYITSKDALRMIKEGTDSHLLNIARAQFMSIDGRLRGQFTLDGIVLTIRWELWRTLQLTQEVGTPSTCIYNCLTVRSMLSRTTGKTVPSRGIVRVS